MLKEGDCTAMKIKRCILALSACFMLLLSSCTPKIVVTPSPIGIEVMPATPEICVEAPQVTIVSKIDDGWTEETVIIRMRERKYTWPIKTITAERYNNRLWIVEIDFDTSINISRQYIFDEKR